MTWEETIKLIRTLPEYEKLVTDAYFSEDLERNVINFIDGEEFKETLKIIKAYSSSKSLKILDIGCGNGISSIAFALQGWHVDAIEPDPSDTVGAGAIEKACEIYNVEKQITIHQCFSENLNFQENSFDIVYARQSMHHAYDLNEFIKKGAAGLKKNGLFITIRDHVANNPLELQNFLESHPLHHFYGGENAFSEKEYTIALESAGLRVLKKLRHFDSVINYYPVYTKKNFQGNINKKKFYLAFKKIGLKSFLNKITRNRYNYLENFGNEDLVPGKMYSYICEKI